MANEQEPGAPLVTGSIVIGAGVPPFQGGVAHVTLEDVSRADAAATTVAQAVIPGVSHQPPGAPAPRAGGPPERAGTALPFALRADPQAPPIEPRAHYSVRVWVDRDGDGKAAPGDLYSDQSYPVLTHGCGTHVTITLGPG